MRSLIASALILTLGVSAAQANLLVNGSFEDGVHPAYDFYTDIPGWHADRDLIEVGTGGTYGISGYDGQYVLELDANHNAIVSQTVNLTAGMYKLDFGYALRQNTLIPTNLFDVYWNNTLVASISPTMTNMVMASYMVQGVNGANKLSFVATGNDDSYGGMVDNVGLNAVPAPGAAIPVLCSGLVGLLRRKRRA